jgi:hypothetical protein
MAGLANLQPNHFMAVPLIGAFQQDTTLIKVHYSVVWGTSKMPRGKKPLIKKSFSCKIFFGVIAW